MKINGEFRILLYFVAIFLLSTQLGLVNGDGKCFKEDRFDLPIVPSKSDKIYLLETQRSAHKAANAIYKIILEEILNYTNVEIVNMTNKIEQTTMLRHLSRSKQYNKPSLQISTALWNNPDEPIISDIALSAGALTEPGKYGLFYATQFGPIEFSMLQSPTEKDLKKFTLAEDVSPINITDVDGRCANRTCIPVLGSDIDKEQNIQNLIKYENLSIQVLWLSNLTEVVDHLIKTNQPFIVLHWTPSEITMNFSSINLPSNKYYRFETTTIGKYYRYYAYPNPEPFKVATKALQFLKISKLDFFDLFQNPANSTYSITCEIAKRCVKTMSSDLKRYLPQSKVIFTIGSIYPEDGTKLKDIFEKTVNVINNHSNPDFSIELQSKNGNCQADQVLRHTIEYFNAGIVDGILGPACSETIQPIAGISRYLNIPIISYAAEAPEFDQDKYPYFFRTIGSNGQYGDVYIQFFKMFDWKRFATITEEGKKSTEYIINMEKKSKTDSIESIMDIKMTKQTNTSDIIDHLQELKRRRVRVIIAHVRNELIEVVLCEAYHLKMTAQYNYVWFLPSNPSTKSSRCTSEEINLALNGHFSLIHKPFNKTSIYIENFMTNKSLCELPDRKYMAGCNYFGFAFDAILAYFQAATKLVAESPRAFESSDYRNITRFTELIRDSDFEGVTGRVRFGKGNSRITNITILQWSEDQYNVVGEYQPNITGYKENMSTETGTIYVNQSAIKWAGIPSDGTFDCKLSMLVKMFGTDCENENVTLEILIIVFVFALICAGLFWFVKRRYDNKLRESAKVMKNFGIDLLAPTTATYNTLDKWEVPKESIVINRRLGEGEFGTVFGGEAKFPHYDEWIAVAVKSLKCGATNESKLDFLSEAEAMKRFNHEHIVKLLGVSLQTEPVYTIMEYMLYGDLKTFLLARRHMIHEKINDDSDISPKRLTKYALGIAKALKYLSDNKFVHRDVACRNVLLSADRVAKLGDFGMARSMYENDYYRFNRKGLLPVRWMAPESLALSVFTPASDIWSFGVFLYEIITFGSFPYQGLTNRQALQCIVSKQILTIPSDVKPQLEKLIKACWNQDAKYRPRASDIISLMEQLPLLVSPCLDVPISSVELHENNEPINIDLLAKMGFKKLKSPVIAQMSTINNLDYTNTDANGMIIPMESMNVYPIEEEEDDVVTELIPKSVASSSPSSSSSTSSSSYASSSSSTANNSEAASELYTIETNNDYCSMVPLLNNNNSHDSNHNSTHILDKPSNATITQFSRLNDIEHGH